MTCQASLLGWGLYKLLYLSFLQVFLQLFLLLLGWGRKAEGLGRRGEWQLVNNQDDDTSCHLHFLFKMDSNRSEGSVECGEWGVNNAFFRRNIFAHTCSMHVCTRLIQYRRHWVNVTKNGPKRENGRKKKFDLSGCSCFLHNCRRNMKSKPVIV
jgi:hypothetical protein